MDGFKNTSNKKDIKMSLTYNAGRIIKGPHGTRRAIEVDHDHCPAHFSIADDCHPSVAVGSWCVVKYDPQDTFATIVPSGLVKYRNPKANNEEGYLEITRTDSVEMHIGTFAATRVGGGVVKQIPIADIIEWETKLPEVYKFGLVGFDGEPYVRAYYNPLDCWNGWLKPLVEGAIITVKNEFTQLRGAELTRIRPGDKLRVIGPDRTGLFLACRFDDCASTEVMHDAFFGLLYVENDNIQRL